MKAKLICGGDLYSTSVQFEDGTEMCGVTSVKFEVPDARTPPTLSLTLMQWPAEVEAEAKVYGCHPRDGDEREIVKIVYADGSEWVPQ